MPAGHLLRRNPRASPAKSRRAAVPWRGGAGYPEKARHLPGANAPRRLGRANPCFEEQGEPMMQIAVICESAAESRRTAAQSACTAAQSGRVPFSRAAGVGRGALWSCPQKGAAPIPACGARQLRSGAGVVPCGDVPCRAEAPAFVCPVGAGWGKPGTAGAAPAQGVGR